ncbi:S8 family serine peptidase [Lusitaniella coriacea]|uniref:S8 family serine peptidase n=1 Tax=Lusitaniella coriacea TaxID=1983105 RepID=UPI003CEBC10B
MLENNVGLSDVLHEILSEDLLLDNTAISQSRIGDAIAQFKSALTELSKTGTTEALTEGGVDLPNIEIVSGTEIDGQPGVFSPETNSLYLTKESLSELVRDFSGSSPVNPETQNSSSILSEEVFGTPTANLSETTPSENQNAIALEPLPPRSPQNPEPPSSKSPFDLSLSTLTEGVDYAAGEVIVKFKTGVQLNDMSLLQEDLGISILDSVQTLGVQHWSIENMSVVEAIAAHSNHDLIEYIEPNYTYHLQGTPNDPEYGTLWGLHNTGQTGGTSDADIDAPEAWDISTGNGVVVGVIDTGVDYTHPDLMNNMWVNGGEIAGDGIDNDGNGYVDDVYGYDFINNDSDPFDDHSHGTHVGGTIAAQGNNNTGVIGVAPDANIMALKIFNAAGNTNTLAIVKAIDYATQMGVDLTNNSWGGGGYSQAIYDAIAAAGANNQLFVAAAGNHGGNNDLNPHYPSSYDLDNIIAVARTDHNDQLYFTSGYGATSVDLGAPGSSIYSTMPGGGYGYKGGTSMASPHVAGAAAMLLSQDPTLTAQEVKDKLLNSVDPLASLAGKTVSGGRLNVYNALTGGGGGVLTPVPLDYMTGFETGSLGSEWSNYTTFEGRVQVTNAYAKTGTSSLLLDDSVNGGAISTAAAILHLDASQFLNAQLDFSWLDLNDESNFGLDGVFISGDGGTTWTEVYSLTGGSSFSWTDASINLGNYLQPSTQDFQIKFQQYDNFSAPTDGIAIDDIKVTELVQATSLNYNQGFESGSFGLEWTKDVTQEGRVQVTDAYAASGSYSLLLDDAVNGGDTSTSAAILHVDGSDFLNARLNFKWLDLLDESNPGLDGVFVSEDNGTTWTEVYALTGGSSVSWTDASIDLWNYLQPSTDNFLIKFQQYDNFSAPTDGIAIDDIGLEEVVTAAVPDFKNSFESGSFGLEWTKETTNDGRVDITGAYAYKGTNSMLLDSSTNGINYSTASAILHLDAHNFPGSDLLLSFRWLDLNDEYDVGQDGIFISDDGSVWHEVYAFDTGSSIDWTLGTIDLDQQAANYGLDLYNGNFQVKFQQYDNFSAPTDGIAVDFVKVTEV